MMEIPCGIAVVLSLTVANAAEDTALCRPGKGQAWGYRGDGSAAIDAKPPVSFTVDKNTAWKCPLPSYGLGMPIVVADRTIVVCEPNGERPWPLLMAISMSDGKVQWKCELNHLPATTLTEAQQAEVGKLWSEYWRKHMTARSLSHQYTLAKNASNETQQAELKQKLADLKTVKWDWDGKGGLAIEEYRQLNDKHSPYKSATLTMDGWTAGGGGYGGYCIGEVFATPTTDGKHIYAVTAQGGFFCFDLEGTLQWVKHHPGNAKTDYCRKARSPIIWKDMLLCDNGAVMRGIERASGKLLWSHPVNVRGDVGLNDGTIISPIVIRCQGTDVVLGGKGEAFRLPDGAPLKVEGYIEFGMTAMTKTDEPDVAFFTGGGQHSGFDSSRGGGPVPPAAVRFKLEGTSLIGALLWDGKTVGRGGAGRTGFIYHEGRLYQNGMGIVEGVTGKLLVPKDGNTGVPNTGHMMYLANGHLYGCMSDQKAGTMVVYVNTVEGKPVANVQIPGYNYSHAFAVSGNSLLVRSDNTLWCFR